MPGEVTAEFEAAGALVEAARSSGVSAVYATTADTTAAHDPAAGAGRPVRSESGLDGTSDQGGGKHARSHELASLPARPASAMRGVPGAGERPNYKAAHPAPAARGSRGQSRAPPPESSSAMGELMKRYHGGGPAPQYGGFGDAGAQIPFARRPRRDGYPPEAYARLGPDRGRGRLTPRLLNEMLRQRQLERELHPRGAVGYGGTRALTQQEQHDLITEASELRAAAGYPQGYAPAPYGRNMLRMPQVDSAPGLPSMYSRYPPSYLRQQPSMAMPAGYLDEAGYAYYHSRGRQMALQAAQDPYAWGAMMSRYREHGDPVAASPASPALRWAGAGGGGAGGGGSGGGGWAREPVGAGSGPNAAAAGAGAYGAGLASSAYGAGLSLTKYAASRARGASRAREHKVVMAGGKQQQQQQQQPPPEEAIRTSETVELPSAPSSGPVYVARILPGGKVVLEQQNPTVLARVFGDIAGQAYSRGSNLAGKAGAKRKRAAQPRAAEQGRDRARYEAGAAAQGDAPRGASESGASAAGGDGSGARGSVGSLLQAAVRGGWQRSRGAASGAANGGGGIETPVETKLLSGDGAARRGNQPRTHLIAAASSSGKQSSGVGSRSVSASPAPRATGGAALASSLFTSSASSSSSSSSRNGGKGSLSSAASSSSSSRPPRGSYGAAGKKTVPIAKRRKIASGGATQEIFTRSINIGFGEKPFLCVICHKQYSEKSSLRRHIRIHTGEKPFVCLECGKSYNDKNNLATHIRIHTGEKPFLCSNCGRAFSQRGSLIKHMRTHTGERPYECSVCHKRFSVSNNLKTHLRVHTGEKPFACKDCGKRFSDRSNLCKHTRVHTGEKPFRCKVCSRRFSQESNLVRHMLCHSAGKLHTCGVCSKQFTRKSSLANHLNLHIIEGYQRYQLM